MLGHSRPAEMPNAKEYVDVHKKDQNSDHALIEVCGFNIPPSSSYK